MGQDALELVLAHHPEDALGDRHRGVLRVPAGGEGIRGLLRDDVDLRHRDAGPGGQGADDAIETGRLGLIDRPGAVHGQDDLVGEPVGAQVHDHGHDEGQEHALLPTQRSADEHEQHRQRRQQDTGFHEVAHGSAASRSKRSSRPPDRQARPVLTGN